MNTLPSSKAASRAVKNFVSFPEITDFLDRAQQTMLGFGPDWGDRLLSSVANSDVAYPPYDLLKIDDQHYRIVIAIAGFSRDELDVVVEKHRLTIFGKKTEKTEEETSAASWKTIHKGIATRAFTRTFMLADYTRVSDAKYEDGLLTIDVVREIPEDLAPKKIQIQ